MSVKRHTTYNVVGAAIPLLGTFITVPIYLQAIGEERYAVLIILWTLLGYFGLFDLGLGRAVTNRIASLKHGNVLEREEVFWTALLINVALGCLGALALWSVGSVVFTHLIGVPSALSNEVREALPWMSVVFPLLLTSSVMSGALVGREEFLAQNAVKVGEGILIQIVPLVTALLIGPSLPALVIAILCVRALSGISLFGLCVRQLPIGFKPRLNRTHVLPLFKFGGWVTVTSIIGPLLTTLDRLLIGAIGGVKALTYYSIPFSLATRISVIPASLSDALFPRLSSSNDTERNALLDTATRSLLVVVTPLVVGGMLAMEPFLVWWIDAQFAAKAAPIGEILMIGLWANCLALLPFAEIQGRGRPDLTAKFHLAELLPYLALLWLALEWKGAVGAAMAWSVRVWVDAVLVFWVTPFRNFSMLASASAVLLGSVGALLLTVGTEWQGLAARAGVLSAVVLWAWWAAPAYLKSSAYQFLRRFRRAVAASAR
jgi:O-antigen/teichoic acid export membrane protein